MMENPLRTDADYELFIYSLADRYASIERSTLTFVRRGHTFARVAGELYFAGGYRIVVRERIVFDRLPAEIDWYGYTDMKSGMGIPSSTGMVLSHIRTNRRFKVPIRTINMYRPT